MEMVDCQHCGMKAKIGTSCVFGGGQVFKYPCYVCTNPDCKSEWFAVDQSKLYHAACRAAGALEDDDYS